MTPKPTPRPLPSPCIDICDHSQDGHCRGCSMTRAQKRVFDGVKSRAEREEFLQLIRIQQQMLGGFPDWEAAYREKCNRLGVRLPEDL